MTHQTSLEEALISTSTQTVEELSVVHVTIGRWLSTIVHRKELRPRQCKVLRQDALYFSYGAPYYRPKNIQTQDPLEFPVVLVFDPAILPEVIRFYTFDTGALAEGFLGTELLNIGGLDELYIRSRPEQLVSCFYKSNKRYLLGKVKSRIDEIEPLSLIRRHLSRNLSSKGVDQRHRTIECVSCNRISLLKHLIFVVYPKPMSSNIGRLWKACPKKFKFHNYEPDFNENPSALITHISKILKKELRYMWEKP